MSENDPKSASPESASPESASPESAVSPVERAESPVERAGGAGAGGLVERGVFVDVVRLPHASSLPEYATWGSAGMDVRAALSDDLLLHPGDRVVVPTGLRVAVPCGYELQVRPRSGRSLRDGLLVVNSPGTIDSDYRGEVGVILSLATGVDRPLKIKRGERVAQLVLCPVWRCQWREHATVQDFDSEVGRMDTSAAARRLRLTGEGGGERSGGFGSTGM